jgi:hypothetical protein
MRLTSLLMLIFVGVAVLTALVLRDETKAQGFTGPPPPPKVPVEGQRPRDPADDKLRELLKALAKPKVQISGKVYVWDGERSTAADDADIYIVRRGRLLDRSTKADFSFQVDRGPPVSVLIEKSGYTTLLIQHQRADGDDLNLYPTLVKKSDDDKAWEKPPPDALREIRQRR